MHKRRKLCEESERTIVRGGRRFHSRDTRSSFGSSTGIPANHTTRTWRPEGAHVSSRNTKPRVSRKQVDGKSSRRKGDTSQGKAKRRAQTQAIAKHVTHGEKKTMETTKKRWARYALPEGFAKHGYPRALSCHMTKRSMMGHKSQLYGYQITYK
jgi:hypothetical protein